MSLVMQRRMLLLGLTIVSAALFFSGIHWGLPTAAVDPFLYGDLPPWSGKQIMTLAGERSDDPALGTDISRHLIQNREQIAVLNDNDASRAEIIRRYHLYTAQPDEHVPMMVIARMRPAKLDFDPRYYQYGGLFLYPLAIGLKLASIKGIYLKLTGDVAWYIDHPDAFGRFYVVARAWAAVWGIIGVWAIFWIVRRMTGSAWFAAAGALLFAMMPATINQAHEAKPHLQGVVLELLAVIAAYRYVEGGGTKRAMVVGIACGAAFGSVLYAIYAFSILPIMVWLRPDEHSKRLRDGLIAGNVGLLVYVITNPYVLINLVKKPEVLHSNLGNTRAMYHIGGWIQGIPNALGLIREGASLGVMLVGALAILAWIVMGRRSGPRRVMGGLLAGPCVLVGMQYFAVAFDKPGEYGRFALYLDAVLAIAAISAVAHWVRHRSVALLIVAALLACVAVPAFNYERNYRRDASGVAARWTAARGIARMTRGVPSTIGIFTEPAPYSAPPVDLFHNRLVLLPLGETPTPSMAQIWMRAVDDPRRDAGWEKSFERYNIIDDEPTRISWANKPIVIDVALSE